ncbi:MAG TPA: PDZ domain-containing protein [Thermoanaerobaculia bacterium]|nr:PDZ domain-containing protein [Thermoanaerobaculia bacterium]
MIRYALVLIFVSMSAIRFAAGPLEAATMPDPVSYTLRFPAPQSHYVEVEAVFPTAGRAAIELMMATWTPGSYLIREFARNLEDISAATESGAPLPLVKTRKNRWQVTTRGAARVVVRYRVYAREMSVRTNFVDAGFAILNGAPTFLTLAENGNRPHEVRVVLPPAWKSVVCPLPPPPGGSEGDGRFRAESYDALVDAPIYAGNPALYRFDVAGRSHLLLNEGEGGVWDGPRSAADVERIVREQAAFWGLVPYPRYIFFNLLVETGGGLEHRDSSVLMESRWATRRRKDYVDWLGLVSHELFHAWNVKRLRPIALGPFDYENEVYTGDLWIVEGLTSYYDALLVHRAGLSTREELLKALSKDIETLQTTPGREVQSLEDASFDAWIKYYRRDENFVNSGISYYTKGAVVGFLLDARIRRATGGRRTLDDALRLAYGRYSGARGFRREELRAALDETAGTDLDPWLDRTLDTTGELDYSEALGWYGLRFVEKHDEEDDEDRDDAAEETAGWLGAETEEHQGRLVVKEVKRGTPAYEAGLNVDDEIVGLGDYRVTPEHWKDRLKVYRPGETVEILVARRDRLVRLPVTFAARPKTRWKLAVDPKATPEQKAHLDAWLHSSARPDVKEEAEEKSVVGSLNPE